ncbi:MULTISPECIES: ECF transporter S component [unclassified Fusibacter]|uniref:ECF transporter S component n=1 Tax=unclassified Fusibacter TaxID=2624464 RepID=UPI0010120C83|nr:MULTISPECIES: ECF transporter S component [unclassified Fusibacter]MCK8060285.1 ECF transporter S component [Fusibacter sp. A2]NPE20426.1 ECF transporter S component [Fusibacter sp. A1]RXV63631.1 ECF transporter S component [Fusibacter sp. A1]
MTSISKRELTKKFDTKEMIRASVLMGTGVIVPFAMHFLGAASPVFLPMHIPVIVAGFILTSPYAVLVAIMTPLVNSLLTGMPPIYPILPIMIVELTCYALAANLSYKKFKLIVLLSLLINLIFGRLGAGLTLAVLVAAMGLKIEQ